MKLNEILAVAGYPGLWRFVAQSTRGVIVESLADGHRMNVPSNARVSSMADISVFTASEDRSLADIFAAFFKQTGGKPTIDHHSDGAEILQTFARVVPDYDLDRVHVSDMKKIIQWYNILVSKGMTQFEVAEQNS